MTRQAPFRFLVLWTMALVIAAAMVSSSARALALGAPGAIVTPKVILERAAAPPRLAVSTSRAPGQERSAATLAAAARRDSPERSGTGDARLAQRPVGVGTFQQVASVGESVRVTPARRSEPTLIDRSKDLWWTIAVAVGGLGAIVVGAILVRQGRPVPKAPSWSSGSMRSRSPTRTRSVTNLSAAPVTLAHTRMPPDALLTRAGPTTRAWVAPASAVTLPNLVATKARSTSGAATRSRASLSPASGLPDGALDTLLNEIDSDLNVEHAVRQVHAAARNQIERDIGGDAILKAIEAAERDLMLTPPAPAETALGHALDNELLGGKPQRPKKVSASR